ncbi:MAG: glycoside hydrolase family 13 protein [Bacteroidales bacterium]|nr:glycoside hydrolase family 13 protein [Bacteroidales bacterium]MCF8456984.1 glycoside hydrolase family 13 protein [Bacteroidales bacterium]
MKTNKLQLIFLLLITYLSANGNIKIHRVEPSNWWVGMYNPELQIMVYGEDLEGCKVVIDYPGITLKDVIKVENPHYLFLNIRIGESAKTGEFSIDFLQKGKKKTSFKYPLLQRKARTNPRGFTNSDVIYLLMPDRFANGNPQNDNLPGMLETTDRTNPDGRHGGDLAGIIEHLDYVKDFGATALWINPLLENNQEKYSYHGYAISDFYKTDPRFGTNKDYFKLVDRCHEKGLKVIQDQVFNHCGIGHWWMKDLPQSDWVHQFPEFTRSNFRVSALVDPYASKADREKMNNGWFDKNMPDLNQDNPLLATYLIQNSIWWVESASIDGIRVDTYPYPSQDMMKLWVQRIRQEYPDITLLGEVWVGTPSIVSLWEGDCFNKAGLQSVFDFPLYDAMKFGFTEKDDWNTGIVRLYDILAQDFLYKDPFNHVVFVDNHDVERIFTTLHEDYQKFKTLITFILTTRGIPTIYYGTELLMTGEEKLGHGHIRKDFPGGWPGDSINAFTEIGRTPQQNEAFDFISKLIKWRNENPVIHSGKLTQFIPEDEVYVYFRQNEEKTVMVVLNQNKEDKLLDTKRFAECLVDCTNAKNVITGETIGLLDTIKIMPGEPVVLEMERMRE